MCTHCPCSLLSPLRLPTEMAENLVHLGLETSVVEMLPQVSPKPAGPGWAPALRGMMESALWGAPGCPGRRVDCPAAVATAAAAATATAAAATAAADAAAAARRAGKIACRLSLTLGRPLHFAPAGHASLRRRNGGANPHPPALQGGAAQWFVAHGLKGRAPNSSTHLCLGMTVTPCGVAPRLTSCTARRPTCLLRLTPGASCTAMQGVKLHLGDGVAGFEQARRSMWQHLHVAVCVPFIGTSSRCC